MKYKHAKVISHPRAGSHYFAKLLNANFFHKFDYLDLYAGHSDGHKVHLKSPSTAVFYIYRNNTDAILSMYNLRDRLGLVAESLEEFKNTKFTDMASNSIKSKAIYDNGEREKIIRHVDSYLGNFPNTPETYLEIHKAFWKELNKSNYMLISYDDLRTDFQETMKLVAWFLGSKKEVFNNIDQRIGWYDYKEVTKIFS